MPPRFWLLSVSAFKTVFSSVSSYFEKNGIRFRRLGAVATRLFRFSTGGAILPAANTSVALVSRHASMLTAATSPVRASRSSQVLAVSTSTLIKNTYAGVSSSSSSDEEVRVKRRKNHTSWDQEHFWTTLLNTA